MDRFATEHLAELIVATDRADISQEAFARASLITFDVLASATAGVHTSSARASRKVASRVFGDGQSPVWLTDQQTSPAGAILANVVATTVFDLDDGHRLACGHPSAGVVAAALTVSNQRNGLGDRTVSSQGNSQGDSQYNSHGDSQSNHSADDLLTAMVIGYEVGVRVSAARDRDKVVGWASGQWLAYAAAATSARLLGLDVATTTQALAIAGAHWPNMMVNAWTTEKGTSVKEGMAWSAMTGYVAAELAADGFTGPRDPLDGDSPNQREVLVNGTGVDWAITRNYFKQYSACRHVHPGLDMVLALADNGDLPQPVERIEVFSYDRALALNNYPAPPTVGSAQFSIPYCLALAATHGRGAVTLLQEHHLADEDVLALAKRVTLHLDPGFDAAFPARTGARIIVHGASGTVERSTDDASGDWALGDQDALVRRKFDRLCAHTGASEGWARGVPAAIDALGAGDVEPLQQLLGWPASSGIQGLPSMST